MLPGTAASLLQRPAESVTSKSKTQLRLHVEQHPDDQALLPIAPLAPLVAAFERATGWQLRLEQTPAGLGETWSTTIDSCGQAVERLVLCSPADAAALDLEQARPLAKAIGEILSETSRLRHAVREREAELAAGVPVTLRKNEEAHLAERLEAVLKGGAEAMGCQAAGLYLLDETTTELKLRACWGLPPERLLAPARPLRGSIADLEALVGQAVVLEDTSLLPHWRCPENYPAAVCVPVSSPSIPLGTLWVFSDEQRDFSPEETNLLEIVAGRLAADLEREMLLTQGAAGKLRDKQFHLAARWLSDRLPSIAPLVDGYEIAGWTQPAEEVGGDFHDWSVLDDGRVSLAVGDADGALLEAALGATSLHTALKAHAAYRHCASALLTRVNESLSAASAGDQRASLAYALLEPATGEIELSLAGNAAVIVAGPENRLVTTTDGPRLGEGGDSAFSQDQTTLQPGEMLVLISGGVRAAVDEAGLCIGEAAIASLVARHLRDSAAALVTRLRRLLEHDQQVAEDMTVLVVKRRTTESAV
jgi:serine phosphatase RsbU (regulator of sigma subunit)